MIVVIHGMFPACALLLLGAQSNDAVIRHWRCFQAQMARLATHKDSKQRDAVVQVHEMMLRMFQAGRENAAEELRVWNVTITTGQVKFVMGMLFTVVFIPV